MTVVSTTHPPPDVQIQLSPDCAKKGNTSPRSVLTTDLQLSKGGDPILALGVPPLLSSNPLLLTALSGG